MECPARSGATREAEIGPTHQAILAPRQDCVVPVTYARRASEVSERVALPSSPATTRGFFPTQCVQRAGIRCWAAGPRRPDCVAGVGGLELRNVDANYLFERSHRFAGIQPNSGFGDYLRLSCGVGDTPLSPVRRRHPCSILSGRATSRLANEDTVGVVQRAKVRSELRIFELCCACIFSRVLGLQRNLVGRDRIPHQILQSLFRVSAGSRAAFCRRRFDCMREQARRLIRASVLANSAASASHLRNWPSSSFWFGGSFASAGRLDAARATQYCIPQSRTSLASLCSSGSTVTLSLRLSDFLHRQ